MMVVWVLANPDTFRSVALQFGTRPGTVHYHYLYILEVLVELAPRFITWPTAAERQETKNYFEELTGFPGIIGCIEGTHHHITAPRYDKIRYINRHDRYSVNTQVLCDHRLLIRDIFTGSVGCKPDAEVLRDSPLCAQLVEGHGVIDFDEHILGDGGYFLATFVSMTLLLGTSYLPICFIIELSFFSAPHSFSKQRPPYTRTNKLQPYSLPNSQLDRKLPLSS